MAKVGDAASEAEKKGPDKDSSFIFVDFGERGSATFTMRQNEVTSGQIAALIPHLQILVEIDMTEQILAAVQGKKPDVGLGPDKLFLPPGVGNTR